ncbi:MAG: kinase [Magnetococcales bacterium]|nr:kinase [Magnetococcales bacterium]MBF0438017.1 kinase [Magnetococcales bacterium]
MIITRTPFRISFFGGGTDYPAWYHKQGGAVLSVGINKYCFITLRYLPPFFNYHFRIQCYRKEETQTIDEIQHPSVRECLRFTNIKKGVEIVHSADLPSQAGLGSSSTFTVGLLHALFTLKNKMLTKRELALNAIHVEQNLIQEHVGSQDQTIAAFGGLNKIEFGGPQHILVRPIAMRQEKLELLQNHLMLFFTGFSRNASDIASEQIRLTASKTTELHKMMELTEEAISILLSEEDRLDDFGLLLHEQWMIKRGMTHLVSTQQIDDIYAAGLQAGALGGKLLGAGGGGFMLFFVRPEDQPHMHKTFNHLLHVPIRFDHTGSQVIYYGNHS